MPRRSKTRCVRRSRPTCSRASNRWLRPKRTPSSSEVARLEKQLHGSCLDQDIKTGQDQNQRRDDVAITPDRSAERSMVHKPVREHEPGRNHPDKHRTEDEYRYFAAGGKYRYVDADVVAAIGKGDACNRQDAVGACGGRRLLRVTCLDTSGEKLPDTNRDREQTQPTHKLRFDQQRYQRCHQTDGDKCGKSKTLPDDDLTRTKLLTGE